MSMKSNSKKPMQTIPPSLKKGFYGFFFKKRSESLIHKKSSPHSGQGRPGSQAPGIWPQFGQIEDSIPPVPPKTSICINKRIYRTNLNPSLDMMNGFDAITYGQSALRFERQEISQCRAE
jgi:hypothetical protein